MWQLSMSAEWRHRIDFLLVLVIVIVVGSVVWRDLGPHFYDMGAFVVGKITDAINAVLSLIRR